MSSFWTCRNIDCNHGLSGEFDYAAVAEAAKLGCVQSLALILQVDDLVVAGAKGAMPRPDGPPESGYSGISPCHSSKCPGRSAKACKACRSSRRTCEYCHRPGKIVKCRHSLLPAQKKASLSSDVRGRDRHRRRCNDIQNDVSSNVPDAKDLVDQMAECRPSNQPDADVAIPSREPLSLPLDIRDDYCPRSPPRAPRMQRLKTPELSPIRGQFFPDFD